MRAQASSIGLLLVVALGVRSAADAQPADTVAGAFTFRTHCTRCHGTEGRGDGPSADNLRFQPPDLRLIAKRNRGEFPADRMRRIVDGRVPVKGHGGSEMPIWGDVLKNADVGYDSHVVELQIRAVVEYLRSLQVP